MYVNVVSIFIRCFFFSLLSVRMWANGLENGDKKSEKLNVPSPKITALPKEKRHNDIQWNDGNGDGSQCTTSFRRIKSDINNDPDWHKLRYVVCQRHIIFGFSNSWCCCIGACGYADLIHVQEWVVWQQDVTIAQGQKWRHKDQQQQKKTHTKYINISSEMEKQYHLNARTHSRLHARPHCSQHNV